MKIHPSSIFLAFFFFIFVSGSASLSKEFLGIAPEDVKYFKSGSFKCKDGSKSFNKDRLNDDFCDCVDGTDEPGTSACPEGNFYCINAGHVPLVLYSSRVNDGICDCCDGSDEYDGKVKCPDTCWEAGKVARDRLKKKISTYLEGVVLRKQDIEQTRQTIAKEEAELAKLRNEEKVLKELVKKLKEHKEQIEKAEEQERIEKEKEERRLKEAEEKANEQEKQAEGAPDNDMKDAIDELPESLNKHTAEDSYEVVETENDHDAGNEESPDYVAQQVGGKIGYIQTGPKHAADDNDGKNEDGETEDGSDAGSEASPAHVVQQEQKESDSTEGLSREELGRLVASRWTGENAGQQAKELDDNKEVEHEGNHDVPDSRHGDEYDGYPSDSEDEGRKYVEDDDEFEDGSMGDENEDHEHDDSSSSDAEDKMDFSDLPTPDNPSLLDKIKEVFHSILQAVKLFKTPVDKSEAARVRKEYDDYSAKLSKIQARISALAEKLKQDFGMDKEFYPFYDQCFESKQNKYVYKVCPYKQASQVEGYSTTQLGRWDKFEDSYRIMQFSHGDKCWNGPDRSLKVKLRCGLKNELTDVDEPSRCEYVALLSTPAVCLEERLKELQRKLDSMNTNQRDSHDEL